MMQYFSCSIGISTDYTKSALRHVTSNLCFCIPVCTVCETSMRYFSFLGGTSTDSTKSAPGHIMLNLCFCI
jgi:hypothetical protein